MVHVSNDTLFSLLFHVSFSTHSSTFLLYLYTFILIAFTTTTLLHKNTLPIPTFTYYLYISSIHRLSKLQSCNNSFFANCTFPYHYLASYIISCTHTHTQTYSYILHKHVPSKFYTDPCTEYCNRSSNLNESFAGACVCVSVVGLSKRVSPSFGTFTVLRCGYGWSKRFR